ncbi:hypothetical protein SLEP1_g12448 [Rubroshorea leprosula]|uniref:Glycosyltransferase 61 catalytic domain-containing protein n=1 Tax=Rubroshorea leprosula TaxID=152421 RepID=A0AAV5IN88_9ROSI|nr:hypothetical protein SLEP1_g12448 [Rubroshorea leprosula]
MQKLDPQIVVMTKEERLQPLPVQFPRARKATISCDRSHQFYDICLINGSTVLDPTTSTFFVMDPSSSSPPYTLEKIRPYPRKAENHTMATIKELTLTSGPGPSPPCEVQHNVPAIVFSAGGYTGNFFHDLSDGFIPLFITINSIFDADQDFILVISKARDWWVNRYADLLHILTKHPIINLDNDTSTHCFTSTSVGLISHGLITVDPTLLPHPKTLSDFRSMLGEAFGHLGSAILDPPKVRPRLVFISRPVGIGRVLLNEEEAKRVAEEIGFEVVLFEPKATTSLSNVYALLHTSHAMIGVHGAALTHLLFLRPGSVFMQVVPLGTRWAAEVCYGMPARAVQLEYIEYKIGVEESSLVEKYDKNGLVIKDPIAFRGKNWSTMNIYLKEQNVKLNIVRFGAHLKEAYKIAKRFMEKEG